MRENYSSNAPGWFAIATMAILISLGAAHGEDSRTVTAGSSPAKKQFRTMGLLYVDITPDSTGAVARVDFLNKVPVEIQQEIRNKVIGHHFGLPNHTYRRSAQYRLFDLSRGERLSTARRQEVKLVRGELRPS